MEDLPKQIAKDWEKIKESKPLLHHITNFVVMNETANVTLAVGALPVMAQAREEVEEMVEAAGALVLNIGTLTPELINSMVLAGKRANERGIPVVLDPVGVGATSLRTESARRLLREIKIEVVRGNSAEVAILAGYSGAIKGVEAVKGIEDIERIAKEFAFKKETVIAITGKEDVVSDGNRIGLVENGDEMLSRITGTGCMATTLIAAFAAVNQDYFTAAMGGLLVFGLAGEMAAKGSEGLPGTFHVKLYDALAKVSTHDILNQGRAEILMGARL